MVFAVLSISTLWIKCCNPGTRASLFLAFINSVVTTGMTSHTECCGSALRPQAYY